MRFVAKLVKPEYPPPLFKRSKDHTTRLNLRYAEVFVEARGYQSAARVHALCNIDEVPLRYAEVVIAVRRSDSTQWRYFRIKTEVSATEVKV
jgi:hypothetical protein